MPLNLFSYSKPKTEGDMQIGESIRRARQNRRMTLVALAESSGLTKGFISQIESGKSNPSLASLKKIALALDLPISGLVESEPMAELPQAAERPREPLLIAARNLYQDKVGMSQLTGSQAGSHFMAAIPAWSSLRSEARWQNQGEPEALCIVLQGSLIVRHTPTEVQVAAGEIATWNANGPYAIENHSARPASAIIFLPEGCGVPALVRLLRPVPLISESGIYASLYEGPMRLVGMRARRQAERKR